MSVTFTPTDLVSLNRVQSLVVAPEKTWAVVGVDRLDKEGAKYISELRRVDLTTGDAKPMTRGPWNDSDAAFDDDGRLYFLSNRPSEDEDKTHDKRKQVWRFDGVGDPTQITFEPLGVSKFAVCDGGELFYQTRTLEGVAHDELRETFDARVKDGPSTLRYSPPDRVRFWDHWIPETTNELVTQKEGKRIVLLQGDIEQWTATPDAQHIFAVTSQRGSEKRIREFRLFDIDRDGKKTEIYYEPQTFVFALVVSNDHVGFVKQTWQHDAYGAWEIATFDIAADALTLHDLSRDNRLVPHAFCDDGTLLLTGDLNGGAPVFTLADGTLTQRTDEGGYHHTVASFDGGLCGIRSEATRPPEVFTISNGEDTSRVISKISGFDVGAIAAQLRVSDHYTESTDGAPIHHRHVRIDDDTKRPLLLWIHGGPISAWSDVWHWRWNPVVAASFGYHVVCPNPRGSVGFGQQFIEEMFGDVWGGQCYDDLMAVTDAVAQRPEVDATKSCAMGGSFGGYMTNWIGTQTDRFTCLVTHASIADNHGFYATTDAPMWWLNTFAKDPYEDRTAFDTYSPLRYVENWKTPVLIVHGDKDYRVPITESLTLYEALDVHGVDCQMMIFPDENHWILRPKNAIDWYEKIFAFIESKLA